MAFASGDILFTEKVADDTCKDRAVCARISERDVLLRVIKNVGGHQEFISKTEADRVFEINVIEI